jgi:MYXO-CTERM domain-containing protein
MCDSAAQKCVACTSDPECETGNYCDDTAGACQPQLPNGESCKREAACTSKVCFSDGKCGAPDGEACSDASVCRTGSCTDSVCGNGIAPETPMDASVAPTKKGKLQVQGGGLLGCSTTPGRTGEGGVALMGLITVAAAVRRRRRRSAR